MNRAWQTLLDLVVPAQCVFCGGECSGEMERSICTGCFYDLPWSQSPVATQTGLFECSVAMLRFEFPVDAAIRAFKFNRKAYYAPAFGECLCVGARLLPPDIDAILPVPLHWYRKAKRGYNQAEEIAAPLRRMLGVPPVRNVRRRRATPPQSGLDAVQRAKNLAGAFAVHGEIRYRHVLIVDDVVTTGATANALAGVLLGYGLENVSLMTVARAE